MASKILTLFECHLFTDVRRIATSVNRLQETVRVQCSENPNIYPRSKTWLTAFYKSFLTWEICFLYVQILQIENHVW